MQKKWWDSFLLFFTWPTRELCPYEHENGCGGVCPKCGLFHKILQQQIKAKHTIEKTFKCEQCGTSFGTKGNLKQHIEAIHLKKWDFACDICGSKFYFKHKMEEHVKARHLGTVYILEQ